LGAQHSPTESEKMYIDSSQFSKREKDVVKLLLQGKSNKQIALELGISNRTVEFHLGNIYAKLGVTSRTEAIVKFSESHLWESTGDTENSIQVKSTVDINSESAENGSKPISRRIPMNKLYMIIGGGLLTITLIVVFVLANMPAQNTVVTPTVYASATSVIQLPPETSLPPTTFYLPEITPVLPDTATTIPTGILVTAAAGEQQVKIFLIAVDDNGRSGKQIGCGDSVVPVMVPIPQTQGVLKAALEALLAVQTQFYGESGLYNALYQSDLQLESVTIMQGVAQIWLTGTLEMGGECDSPRVEAQLIETAMQFSTVKAVEVYLNGNPLQEFHSLK
jgi:DNA-binding CsgD family transcriptional regulator